MKNNLTVAISGKRHQFGMRCAILADFTAVSALTGEGCGTAAMGTVSGSTYTPVDCRDGFIAYKTAAPGTAASWAISATPDAFVLPGVAEVATLDGVAPRAATGSALGTPCDEVMMAVPSGWAVASWSDLAARAALSAKGLTFGARCLVFSDGVAYNIRTLQPCFAGQVLNCVAGVSVTPTYCSCLRAGSPLGEGYRIAITRASSAAVVPTPEPVNTVALNGMLYASLDDAPVRGTAFYGCQDTAKLLPAGWRVAKYGPDTRALLASSAYTFGTRCMAMLGNRAVFVETGADCSGLGADGALAAPLGTDKLITRISGYLAVRRCPTRILITRPANATGAAADSSWTVDAAVPLPTASIAQGATLQLAAIDGSPVLPAANASSAAVSFSATSCSRVAMRVPSGWEVAPDAPAVREIIAALNATFGVPGGCLVLASGAAVRAGTGKPCLSAGALFSAGAYAAPLFCGTKVLLARRPLAAGAPAVPLTTQVCIGAGGVSASNPAAQLSVAPGTLVAVRLRYVSGSVSCNTADPSAVSRWGCVIPGDGTDTGVGIVALDVNRLPPSNLLYPATNASVAGFFPPGEGYDPYATALRLTLPTPITLLSATVLQLAYSEVALGVLSDVANNNGTVCAAAEPEYAVLTLPAGTAAAATATKPAFTLDFGDACGATGFSGFPGSGVVTRVSGVVGRGIRLAGGFVDLGRTRLDAVPGTAFGAGLWIKRAQPVAGRTLETILSRMDMSTYGGTRGWGLFLRPATGALEVSVRSSVSVEGILMAHVVTSAARVPVGVWTHVAFTYDGERRAAGIAVFVDGVQVALDEVYDSIPTAATATTATGKAANLVLGARGTALGTTSWSPLYADVDELAVYEGAVAPETFAFPLAGPTFRPVAPCPLVARPVPLLARGRRGLFSALQNGTATASSNVTVMYAPDVAGCADLSREGFQDVVAYPDIAGCSLAFGVPGTRDAVRTCSPVYAGNDGLTAWSECSLEDACADGWHVCLDAAEVSVRSRSRGCDPLIAPGLFFATKQGLWGSFDCQRAFGSGDPVGCGAVGTAGLTAAPSGCLPLNARAGPGVTSWAAGSVPGMGALNAWKPTAAGGGALCCRDPVSSSAPAATVATATAPSVPLPVVRGAGPTALHVSWVDSAAFPSDPIISYVLLEAAGSLDPPTTAYTPVSDVANLRSAWRTGLSPGLPHYYAIEVVTQSLKRFRGNRTAVAFTSPTMACEPLKAPREVTTCFFVDAVSGPVSRTQASAACSAMYGAALADVTASSASSRAALLSAGAGRVWVNKYEGDPGSTGCLTLDSPVGSLPLSVNCTAVPVASYPAMCQVTAMSPAAAGAHVGLTACAQAQGITHRQVAFLAAARNPVGASGALAACRAVGGPGAALLSASRRERFLAAGGLSLLHGLNAAWVSPAMLGVCTLLSATGVVAEQRCAFTAPVMCETAQWCDAFASVALDLNKPISQFATAATRQAVASSVADSAATDDAWAVITQVQAGSLGSASVRFDVRVSPPVSAMLPGSQFDVLVRGAAAAGDLAASLITSPLLNEGSIPANPTAPGAVAVPAAPGAISALTLDPTAAASTVIVPAVSVAPSPTQVPNATLPTKPPAKKSSAGAAAAAVIIILLLIAGAAGTAYWWFVLRKRREEKRLADLRAEEAAAEKKRVAQLEYEKYKRKQAGASAASKGGGKPADGSSDDSNDNGKKKEAPLASSFKKPTTAAAAGKGYGKGKGKGKGKGAAAASPASSKSSASPTSKRGRAADNSSEDQSATNSADEGWSPSSSNKRGGGTAKKANNNSGRRFDASVSGSEAESHSSKKSRTPATDHSNNYSLTASENEGSEDWGRENEEEEQVSYGQEGYEDHEDQSFQGSFEESD